MTRSLAGLCLVLVGCGSNQKPGESVCYGTPESGKLEGGVSLPLSGANFESYSFVGWSVGRTHVHSRVRTVLLEAFAALEKSAPEKVFVYGETGWAAGGQIRPHKTHRNGLSVDLMVPTLSNGQSVPLPTSMFNKYGYDIEFDGRGVYDEYQIDWQALGQWLYELDVAAKRHKVGIRRVIFEVPLQKHLFRTRHGAYLKREVVFSTKQAWVRHDEHFHVDFSVPCRPMPGS